MDSRARWLTPRIHKPISLLLLCASVFSIASAQTTTTSDASSTSAVSSNSAATSTITTTDDASSSASGIIITSGFTVSVPTGSYATYSSQINLITSSTTSSFRPSNFSSNATPSMKSSTSSSTLYLVGTRTSTSTSSGSGSATTTVSTSAAMTNTQPCNDYVEFCDRKYSNITQVCAHNSDFTRPNSLFSNQQLLIPTQLNDGIRMIQGETHYLDGTIYSCHTNCSFLNMGTYESELVTVREWVEDHPYDIVTILIVNSDFVNVNNYTAPIINSGLHEYVYYPPKLPMRLEDWPTLGEMILAGTRVVVFMDYMADQTAVPYILDEFSQMWETPFSPTDPEFPCTIQRPPGITDAQAEDRLYLANHNLNYELNIVGSQILIPDVANLTEVNAMNGTAGLYTMGERCDAMWGRPPNFLLVDYYNVGNGSVFEAAAKLNNVTYTRKCCGLDNETSGVGQLQKPAGFLVALVFMVSTLLILA